MSKIEWTGLTWNPTTGCDKVSRGCKFCYAEIMHRRLRAMGQDKYDHKFLGQVEIHPKELSFPGRHKKPQTIFVDSMSDLFHDSVPFGFIKSVYVEMAMYDQHTYQILTKRPHRAIEFYSFLADYCGKYPSERITSWYKNGMKNVWIGTSVENQEQAGVRIPALIHIPAAVRFLSCEPLLGQLAIMNWLPHLHWVIAGGESGNKKGVEPMHPDWARFLRDQCKAMKVPFFFKQWGAWHESDLDPGEGIGKTRRHLFPDGKLMYRLGKDKTGNILDGQQHLEMPTI